jgi:hypothetical protein
VTIPAPRYAVNSYSTPHNSIFDDIEQIARTGGQAVGVWEGKFTDGDDNRIADALQAHRLGTSFAVPAMHAILSIPFERPGSPTDIQQRTNLICASIERLARFRPQVIAIAPGTSGIADAPAGPVEDVVRALPQIADTAAQYGAGGRFRAPRPPSGVSPMDADANNLPAGYGEPKLTDLRQSHRRNGPTVDGMDMPVDICGIVVVSRAPPRCNAAARRWLRCG